MQPPHAVSYEDEPTGLFSCHVALGGDPRQVVVRDATNPVFLPEIYLLKNIHGDGAVTDIIMEETQERSRGYVMQEMIVRYGVRAHEFFRQFPLAGLPLVSGEFPDRETTDEIARLTRDLQQSRKKAPAKASSKKAQAKASEPEQEPAATPAPPSSELPDL